MQSPRLGSVPRKPGLWRRTPPALFTPIFGLFGLALGWRRAVDAFGAPEAPGEILFGAVTLLYLFVLLAYAAKVLRRPGVVVDDLKVLPGRAGLAAAGLGAMLMALGLLPVSGALSATILMLATAIHGLIAFLVIRGLLRAPAEARGVTPVWHLSFVGFIVSALAAVPLGWSGYATVIFWISFAVAVGIWGASVAQFVRRDVPAPLRPLLAIHLAPASLLGSVALLLGYHALALGFGGLALAILAALLARPRWLLEAGFSPLWGAFTFPLAAFASLMQMLGAAGDGEVFRVIGGLALVAATLIIPVIMWKVIQLWAKGQLQVKTNAAEA